jgi:hypothetical protein
VEPKSSTKENINSLIEFRQAIYEHGFLARKDALFDLLDALVIEGKVPSFAYLSQSEQFRRKWPSLYAAVEDGRLDSPWLRQYLGRRVPAQGIQVFALDGTSWPRPRGRTLADRQYVYQASSAVNGGTVTIGYPYSLLEWSVESHSSWSLAVDVRRVNSSQTATAVGAEQIRHLAEVRQGVEAALDLVVCDGKYGNTAFLRAVKGLRCGKAKAGASRKRSFASKTRTGERSAWNAGSTCMARAAPISPSPSCEPVYTWSETSRRRLSGWVAWLRQRSRKAWFSRRRRSGVPTSIAGQSSRASISARRAWDGPCRISNPPKPATAGVN